jgi:capsular polysaccharide biosynthesis protein
MPEFVEDDRSVDNEAGSSLSENSANEADAHDGRPTGVSARDGDAGAGVDRVAILWRSKYWILLTAVVVAVITYIVSDAVPKTYSASATVSVTLPPSASATATGEAVAATGDLATQYADTATLGPILTLASKLSGISPSVLGSSTSAGTISGENLISIRGEASEGPASGARANAIAEALVQTVRAQNTAAIAAYSRSVDRELRPLNAQIAALDARLTNAKLNSASQASVEGTLSSLLIQRGSLESQIIQNESSQPTITLLSRAGDGSVIDPKPKLYALIALIVAVLVAGQLSITIRSYRRSYRA